MADGSAIEWTDATWNPVTGCTKITAGCDNCYADPVAYAQLLQAVARFPSVEITPLNGRMEAHADAIAASIPRTAFSFSLIDPKGFPQIGALKPLLTRPNSETLVNFMFDFANRFAGKDLIPALEDWLSATKGEESWRAEVAGLTGIQREEKIESLAAESLRLSGGFTYPRAAILSIIGRNRPA